MNITKVKSKTTLTVATTLMELKANLVAYQNDMIAELVGSKQAYAGSALTFADAVKVAQICFHKGEAFDNLVEKEGVLWVNTPRNVVGWIELLIALPYIFGLTDEVLTDDIEVVTLVLDGRTYDISDVKDSI